MSNPEWWLDPPDLPTHAVCDNCEEMFDYDDLTAFDGWGWICKDCLVLAQAEEEEENED